jgi:hypothetical protein
MIRKRQRKRYQLNLKEQNGQFPAEENDREYPNEERVMFMNGLGTWIRNWTWMKIMLRLLHFLTIGNMF